MEDIEYSDILIDLVRISNKLLGAENIKVTFDKTHKIVDYLQGDKYKPVYEIQYILTVMNKNFREFRKSHVEITPKFLDETTNDRTSYMFNMLAKDYLTTAISQKTAVQLLVERGELSKFNYM